MRVYRSNETEWIDESYTVTMYGLGIEALIELNNDIAISYIEQENDAYGYMSCYSYDSKHMEIENITKIKEGLFDYTQRIHEIIAEKDQTYLKEINEVFEEFSHLDINEYTVPNSLGITEYVDTAVAYYNGTSAINSGMVTKSVMIEQEKKEITLKDILLKTDAYRIEASIKKRIQEEGVVLSANDIEMVKNYQITMLTTSNYNHQFYVNEGTRITMIVLDALPIVGGIKNISEAMFGHSWVGEKLTEEERKAVGGIGTFSLLLDVFTLGSGGLSNLGKNYVIDATATLAFTGGSEIASQLLLETGLTPEQILVIKYIVGAGIIGYNGYKRMEDYFDKKVVDPSQFKNDFIEGASGADSLDDWAKHMSPEDAKRYELWNSLRENGLDQAKINDIILTNKGLRPNPNTYLSETYIKNHLKQFDGGVTKIMTQAPTGTAGPPGGTFVMPSSVADDLIVQAGGDVSKLEKLLSLELGTLGSSPVRVDVKNPSHLRVPSGNELGANSQWLPGGNTGGGIPEETITSPKPGDYIVKPIK